MESEATEHPPAPEIVFPNDNRVRIDPTNVDPYFWVGQLDIEFPSGAKGSGTGTLIEGHVVLTCAHNLFQKQYGGYASMVLFTLARNGATYPYRPVSASSIHVSEEYQTLSPPAPNEQGNVQDYTRYLFDFGIAKLENILDPAEGVYPGMYAASDTGLNGRLCDIAGYPGDKQPKGTLWNGSGTLPMAADELLLFYTISTYGGQSGSAVRTLFPNAPAPGVPRIVGIHVAGSVALRTNFAVRITTDVVHKITSWL